MDTLVCGTRWNILDSRGPERFNVSEYADMNCLYPLINNRLRVKSFVQLRHNKLSAEV